MFIVKVRRKIRYVYPKTFPCFLTEFPNGLRPDILSLVTGENTKLMKTIRLFGMLKTLVPEGKGLDVHLPPGSQVSDLIDVVNEQYPEIGEMLLKKKVLISVNQEIAHWETILQDTDEIALLPPFAGGC